MSAARSNDAARPETPAVADCRTLSLTPPRWVRTRLAGAFLFLPLLAQLGFDRLVHDPGYLGSRMIPAVSALISLLILKLLNKERRSHINDFNFAAITQWLKGHTRYSSDG
jgi:hypothetical protein